MNAVAIISVIGTFFISTVAGQQPSNTSTGPISCYVCTSALNPACADSYEGSSKFPHEKVLEKGLFLKPCNDPSLVPHHEPNEAAQSPVGCRKILQEVNSATRVVRQCAYGGEDVNGLKRTGNEGVRLFYYQCHNKKDEDGCNGAVPNAAFWLFSLCLPLALAALW